MFNKLAAFADCISSVLVSFQIRRLVGFEPNFQRQGVLLLDDSLLKQRTMSILVCQLIFMPRCIKSSAIFSAAAALVLIPGCARSLA